MPNQIRKLVRSVILIVACLTLLTSVSSAQEEWYRVAAGDTLASIAAQFGVTAGAIIEHNGLAQASPIVRGQILRIPSPTVTPAPESDNAAEFGRTHIVQPGEALHEIGERYGVDWRIIAALNNIGNPNLIYAGQALVLPASSGPDIVATPQPVSAPPTQVQQVQASGQYRLYRARFGDSFARIAQNVGISTQALLQLNGIRSDARLYVGDILLLPPAATAAVAAPTVPAAPSARQYVVRYGDTLADIAALYGRTILEIVAANGLLNPNVIKVGQVLDIP